MTYATQRARVARLPPVAHLINVVSQPVIEQVFVEDERLAGVLHCGRLCLFNPLLFSRAGDGRRIHGEQRSPRPLHARRPNICPVILRFTTILPPTRREMAGRRDVRGANLACHCAGCAGARPQGKARRSSLRHAGTVTQICCCDCTKFDTRLWNHETRALSTSWSRTITPARKRSAPAFPREPASGTRDTPNNSFERFVHIYICSR